MYEIEVSNLTKSFGKGKNKVKAVDNLSFTVNKGETFGLLGVNGAGKTTTINMLTGVLKYDEGTIRIFGKDPEKDREIVKNQMNVGNAFYSLSEILTIRQNLRVYGKIYGVNDLEKKMDSLLEMFGIADIQHRKVSHLSSGELTRAVLCKALINDPKVLFLDECTVGLDPDIADKTRSIIKDYQKKSGCTIIFTSHYMAEVEQLCDRIALMNQGKIVKILRPEDIRKSFKNYRVEIIIRHDVEKLISLLNKDKVKIISNKDNKVVFEATWKDDKVFKMLNKIFASGLKLEDLHIEKPSLEDIFIRMARGK